MSASGKMTTGTKLIVGILAVIGVFTLFSSIFWSLWIFLRWVLGPLLVLGLIIYLVARIRDRSKGRG